VDEAASPGTHHGLLRTTLILRTQRIAICATCFRPARRAALQSLPGLSLLAALAEQAGPLFLKKGDLKWSAINPLDEVRVYSPSECHGLQIADRVAGAFYQAVNGYADPAIALAPRMAFDARGSILGYGVKLMPDDYLNRAPVHQQPVFDFYSKEKRQAAVA